MIVLCNFILAWSPCAPTSLKYGTYATSVYILVTSLSIESRHRIVDDKFSWEPGMSSQTWLTLCQLFMFINMTLGICR